MKKNDDEMDKALESTEYLEKMMEKYDVNVVETTVRDYRRNTISYRINATWTSDKDEKIPKHLLSK
ncbi:hypothetical protein CJJ23_04630 [Mycoplasmopsis agassizii]|uniref:Uncharacterized protein n=2 Tax=Mycoplasmopsis agassizii TaxID=33922 RepID=A0A269THS8_9BACT|nr:hypothetical protein CJJ23_04630 [Mycoplasmopsis agassizii]